MTRAALKTSDLYRQPPLMPVWPTFGRDVCGMSESLTYKQAATGQLPVESIRIGRKLHVRTADVLAWLHLPQVADCPVEDGAAESDHSTAPNENALIHTSA